MKAEEDRAIPERVKIAKELANLLSALSHPHRIRIIEALRGRELDVNSLQQILGISHSSVSQNLSVLRAHRVVSERRDGRRVFYSLPQPALADWLSTGLNFLEGELTHSQEIHEALEKVRALWGESPNGHDSEDSTSR